MFTGKLYIESLPAGSNDVSIELLITSPPMTGDSAVGVALIWIALRWRRVTRIFRTGLYLTAWIGVDEPGMALLASWMWVECLFKLGNISFDRVNVGLEGGERRQYS